MTLDELFVSYKQVDPVDFKITKQSLPQPLFLNLDRAKAAVLAEDGPKNTSEDMSDWKVKNPEDISDWRVINLLDEKEGSKKINKRWNSPYKDKNKWISDMTAAYKKAGLNDNAIKNLLAKNSLESSWGASAQGAYNFGNITTGSNWAGNYIIGSDRNANGEKISQKFRSYANLDDYVKDEIQFLTSLYGFNQNDDIDTFLHKLTGGFKKGRNYATDPNYKTNVKKLYKQLYG